MKDSRINESVAHTPGPWILETFKDSVPGKFRAVIKDNSGSYSLAHIPHAKWSELEMDANARLIAAAPELLGIAKAYRNLLKTMAHTDGQVATYQHIQDVITKAEGNQS